MTRKTAAFLTAAALVLFAGVALAQNADQNTGGPTKNTLRMTVAEPTEGSTIVGTVVRVVVAYNRDAFLGQGTRFGEPNYPQPRFDVFLEDRFQTTLKGTEANVAHLENVVPGVHTITILAKNVSGEVIDRKEVNFRTVLPPPPAPVAEKAPAPPPPAPAPAYEPPPAPAPVEAPPALPKTASRAPAAAVAGLVLVAAGLFFRRTR